MSVKRCLASVFALSLMVAGAGAAFASDRAVSDGGRSGPLAEFAPNAGAVRAGAPFIGPDRVTRAEVRATGAEFLTVSGRAPLSELVAEQLGGAEAAESVIGWDSQMRVRTTRYPNRAIGLITIGSNNAHLCTGWFISRNTVATAGHCVHTGGSNGAWRDRTTMRFWPGRDGTSAPYGSCTVARLHSVTGWTVSGNSRYDYGAMRLNCTTGNTTGWFGIYSGSDATTYWNGYAAIISGYPGDEPQYQMLSADRIRVSEALRVCYRMDTVGGHSGSPIWNDRTNGTASTGAWAFAVHAYGSSSCGSTSQLNWAPRLTSGRVAVYQNWINMP